MSNKELIKSILEDIGYKFSSVDNRDKVHEMKDKENILIFLTGSNVNIDEVFKGLQEVRRYGYPLILCISKNFENIVGLERVKSLLSPKEIYLEEDISKIDKIIELGNIAIVPLLTQNTLSKVAVGIQDTLVSNLIWKMLWNNKKVIINSCTFLMNDRVEDNNTIMCRVIKNHIKTIKEYGAQIIKDNDYIKYIDSKVNCNSNVTIEDRKVITERDINYFSSVGEIIINRGTILTPLAKDRAKDKGIKIIVK